MVALLVVTFEEAGALGLALLGLARTLPTTVAVPLVGAVGTRVPAQGLLALTYAIRALRDAGELRLERPGLTGGRPCPLPSPRSAEGCTPFPP